jgi:serine/threonine protein kinase
MALDAGTRLGPYEIVAAIGAGGMGEVYRARDTRLDRTVAMKILNSQLVENPELPNSFFSLSIDTTPDGHRFLVNVNSEHADESRAVVVTNWPARLKQ